MENGFWTYLAVIVAGIVAGFINTLAGSGSLLTLPLLMFIGLPANMANGTNRIGILFQSIVGSVSFRQQKILDIREGLTYSLPILFGSVAGALLALSFEDIVMEKAIGVLLVVMFFLILYKPEVWLKQQAGKIPGAPTILNIVVFFFIGVYGGFVQAGVGFFLLAGLVLGVGADLVKANALKVFLVLVYTPVALAIFMIEKQVDYKLGLILAIGNSIGAYLGSKVAVSWGPKFIRIVLLLAILASALKLFGIF